MNFVQRTWEILDKPESSGKAGKAVGVFIMLLIFLNLVAVILGSVKSIEEEYEDLLYYFEVFSIVVFSVEYMLRVWSCRAEAKYRGFAGKLRYVITPMALIDLIAVLPFYVPFLGVDLRFVRSFRLLRIVRLAKAGRYMKSLRLFGRVIVSKKEELLITMFVTIILLVVASSMMYFFENAAQPDKFSDIPSAMWWAVATLTTVGYGDVYPVTAGGKIIASIVSVLGIGLFALPTGILGAGFVEEFHKSRETNRQRVCPHCGKEFEE